MKSSPSFLFLPAFIFIFLFPAKAQESDSRTAVQWGPWEHAITISNPAEGTPPLVEVIFEGPEKQVLRGSAFTDDGITYTIRAAFPDPGPWRWRTRSTEKDLHHVRGRVEVSQYAGYNPLYHHGDIRISLNQRHLLHEDGTPFLWMGDTGWNASYNSTIDEWKTYIDIRASQRFNVIQINPRGFGNRATSSATPDVSFKPDGRSDPEFWHDLEEKIEYANSKGMVILLTGVGSSWRDKTAANPENQKFESYIAGRMAGYIVVFSPGFDQLFEDELDKIAFELQKWTMHLVTQHPATNQSAIITFRGSTSVDFSGLQSGHHGGDVGKAFTAARQWTLDLWSESPVKPVILLESVYDGYGNDNSDSFREKDSRKPAWISFLSGARGFTYGAGEIPPKIPEGNGAVWMFNKDSSLYDYWQHAVQWESAWQMTAMKDFLESVEWWNLIPAPDLIRNQSIADSLHMVAARTEDLSLIIAYLPDNPRILIDMSFYFGAYVYYWFNPQTGRYNPAINIQGGDPNKIFERPEGWEDAVLKIVRR
jgi:hypothetical protein